MAGGRRGPRPKRGGESFARGHYNDGASDPKKVRFDTRNPAALAADAPEDDAVLDADAIGRRGAQTKRNAVNIDGYASDSSNEGFNARADAKAKGTASDSVASKDEEDEDMFADVEEKRSPDGDEEENAAKTGNRERKEVRIVDAEDIEGQALSSRGGGHISANVLAQQANHAGTDDHSESSSSDEEVGDEERAAVDDVDEEIGAGGKKKHAPKLDAFNLQAEKEEGGFDESLNFVRKATDPDAVHDSWLQGLSKKDMKNAREAQDKRDRELRRREQEDDEMLTGDVLKELILCLEKGETAMEGLARMGRSNPPKKRTWSKRNKGLANGKMDIDSSENGDATTVDESESKRRKSVETITEAADRLMRRGHDDIYDQEREMLIRLYHRETGDDWKEPNAGADSDFEDKEWEYRWSDARDGGEAHGPYDGSTMEAWNNAGYFGEGVEFRRSGDRDAKWSRAVVFV